MRSFLKKYKFNLLIVLVGLLLLITLNFMLQLSAQTLVYPDSLNYLESAQYLYQQFSVHYYRPILMAAITGFPYLFGSSNAGILQWSIFVNVFCWLGTSLLLFAILKDFLFEKTAFWFAIIPFFVLGNLILNFHLLTENIFVFLTLLAFYFLFQYYKSGKFLHLSLSLSVLIFSMLIKPGAKFFAILICLYFIKELVRNYKRKSSFFIYGSVLIVAIQLVGMKSEYGNFTISYIDGVTYHNYICSKAESFKFGKGYNQMQNPRADYLFSLNFPDQKKVAFEDLKIQVRTNFLNVVKAYFSDVAENSKTGSAGIEDLQNKKNDGRFDFWKDFFFGVTKWQNRSFTLMGILLAVLFLAKTYKKPNPLTFISGFVVYVILLSGISCGQGDRFHVVVFPFVVLLLAKSVSEIKPFSEPLQK